LDGFDSPAQAKAIVDRARRVDQAAILQGRTSPNKVFSRLTIDLSTAKTEQQAMQIGLPFTSIIVESITDSSTSLNIRPNTVNPSNEHKVLMQNDTLEFDEAVTDGFLFWDAQPGKTVTLVITFGARFRSGKTLNVNSGGVSISEGSAASMLTPVAVTAATATKILDTNTSRKVANIQVDQDGWYGPTSSVSNTGTNKGLFYPAGSTIQWRNTTTLYVYTLASATATILEET
jgi:hypothetical protein